MVMHYSQQMSSVQLEADHASRVLRVNGSGFVTRDLLQAGLADYLATDAPSRTDVVLVDVRDVAGYGAGCAWIAARALDEARRRGVQRVALVSSSTVLRTATSVLSQHSGLSVRCFSHPESASSWLGAGAASS